jgi:multidrug efflux pump subunit AcrA (membrane-fusion protein)
MFLTAQASIETHLQALVVPPQAVYRDEKNQTVVYRLSGDTADAVPVKLGLETSQQVELLSGVEAGDTVILTGGYGLGEHAKVRVKP